jgi:hypothetical protein
MKGGTNLSALAGFESHSEAPDGSGSWYFNGKLIILMSTFQSLRSPALINSWFQSDSHRNELRLLQLKGEK